jgi:hypothetical protein
MGLNATTAEALSVLDSRVSNQPRAVQRRSDTAHFYACPKRKRKKEGQNKKEVEAVMQGFTASNLSRS